NTRVFRHRHAAIVRMRNASADSSETSRARRLGRSLRSEAAQPVAGSRQSDASPAVPTNRPRVVIVGAGFGGLEAAKGLASAPVDVVVIDRRNHHLFQPLLYQVATAALSPAEVAWPIRRILRRQGNVHVLMAEV